MLPDLKRSTLRNVMLQCYKKSLIPVKKQSVPFLENVLAMIQVGFGLLFLAAGVTFPLETARRRHRTLLHYKATAILLAVAPLPVLPSPPVTAIFCPLAIFVFINTKIKKRFSFWISSALVLFPAFSLHLNSFV